MSVAAVIVVTTDLVELISDRLWGLGVVAVEERTRRDGQVELWTSLGDDVAAVRGILDRQFAGLEWRCETLDDDVGESWRRFASATRVSAQLRVVPAWIEDPAPAEPDQIDLRIEPGSTFGMGDHPTTILSLRAVCRRVTEHTTVLDVGCGSGILAVAAARFGARRAVGIDLHPGSPTIGAANARRNGVAERVSISTTPLAEIDEQFDIVVANILAPVLLDMAPDLRRVTSGSGLLIVSGVLSTRYDHVLAALAPMRTVEEDHLDGWAAVTLRDPTTA